MILGPKQEKFTYALGLLIIYAYSLGYGIRPKHLKRCDDCPVNTNPYSTHMDSLAIDIVLTISSHIVDEDEHYHILHHYWDILGGAKRIEGDLGHFSFAHNGYR